MPNRLPSIALLLLATLWMSEVVAAQSRRELIFQPGSTSFPSSHASTVVELHSGGLMSAWFGGTAERAPDVAIWGSQRKDDQWSTPVELAREPGVPTWNPVLFYTRDSRLWLYYKVGGTPMDWTGARKYSTDEGKTWSATEYLPAGLLGPIRAKPLVLPDGTIVCGSSTESYRSWAVWIERSTDNGKTWAKIGPIVPPLDLDQHGYGDPSAKPTIEPAGSNSWAVTQGIIQPSVVSLGGKHLRLYARSTSKTARVSVADSYDNGLTWTQAHPLDVLNPNSGIDAVALKDGRIVLIYNNTTSGRTPLNLSISKDGEHFTAFATLEEGPGEYSYPALIQAANGDLEMTYTWNRKSIQHVHFCLTDIPR